MIAFDKNYTRGQLNPAIKRYIKNKEKELNRTCRSIWSATNPKGEQYLYGSFCQNYDRLFVTIGFGIDCVNGGFVTPR